MSTRARRNPQVGDRQVAPQRARAFRCGAAIASIRFGVRAGLGNRLVSLEELLETIGKKPRPPLREHFTRRWLKAKISEFSLEFQFEKSKRRP